MKDVCLLNNKFHYSKINPLNSDGVILIRTVPNFSTSNPTHKIHDARKDEKEWP